MAAPKTNKPEPQGLRANPAVVTYLVGYNVAQILGWCGMLLSMSAHMLYERTPVGLYETVAPLLNIFQTAAILEIIHCAVGMVRSNVVLTAFQVYSRVFLTWGVAYSVPATQDSVGIPMFLFAWAVTEVIRYSFYLLAIIGEVPYLIKFLRYTLFIVLYPIGVTGELLTILNSLEYVKTNKLYSIELPNAANISFNYYYFLIFTMVSYIPVFPQLYMHMLAQRKKVIGGADKSKTD